MIDVKALTKYLRLPIPHPLSSGWRKSRRVGTIVVPAPNHGGRMGTRGNENEII
jgi:hypothetical protein